MTKFLNISTDNTLGGNTPSDVIVSSQKAIKEYVDNHGGGGSVDIDNSTITKNSDDEIQAVAVIDQNTGIAKTWTGTQAEYDAIVMKDPETEYIITDDIGDSANVFRKEVSERNIGEIVYSSVPITDSGLHLADGEVLDGTGIYKDFYDYMVSVYNAGHTSIFCSESDWQAEVTANGVCGKYVLDTGLVSIRLPKLKNKVLSDNAIVGNGMTLGLTDGTNTFGLGNTDISGSNAKGLTPNISAYGSNIGVREVGGGYSTENALGITTDPTKSGIEVASSVEILVYIVVANTIKTPVQVDIDNIATELNACYGHRVVEFQEPTAVNNYTWYRKYADGWVEQGGFLANTVSGTVVTLLVEMANIYYDVHIQSRFNSYGNATNIGSVGNSTTTSFTHYHYNDTAQSWSWQVSGMAA